MTIWAYLSMRVPQEFATALRAVSHKRSIITGKRVSQREIVMKAVLEYDKEVASEYRKGKIEKKGGE